MFNGIVTFGLLGLVIYVVYVIKTQNLTLEDMLIEYSDKTFLLLGVYSTFSEVIALAIIAMDSPVREISSFNAISRYGWMGIVELLFSFLFSFMFFALMRSSAINGSLGFKPLIRNLVLSSPLWVMGFLSTSLIALLYLESIGHRELVISGGFFPWSYADFVVVPYEQMAHYVQPELAALILIFTTPFINTMLVVFYLIKVNKTGELKDLAIEAAAEKEKHKKEVEEKKKKDEKEIADKAKKEDDEKKKADKEKADKEKADKEKQASPTSFAMPNSYSSFVSALTSLQSYSNTFDKDNFLRFMFRLCGVNPDKLSAFMIDEKITNDAVKQYVTWVTSGADAGSKKGTAPQDYMVNVIQRLMGTTNQLGLGAIVLYAKKIEEFIIDSEGIGQDFADKLLEVCNSVRMANSGGIAEFTKQAKEIVEAQTEDDKKQKAGQILDDFTSVITSLNKEVMAIWSSFNNMNFKADNKY